MNRIALAALAALTAACGSSSTSNVDLTGSITCGTGPSCASGQICISLTMDGSAGSSNGTTTYTCRAAPTDCPVSECNDDCDTTEAADCCPTCIATLCAGFPTYDDRQLDCYGY